MIKKILLATTLIGNLNLIFLYPTFAQNPPAETYQPGFWQPVARIDLQRSVTVKLNNKTDFALNYTITENKMEPLVIEAEKTATLTDIEIPLYIVIYPSSFITDSSRINLRYDVTADEDNVVTVDIKYIGQDTSGNRTFNIQKTGAIYVY